LLSLPFIRLLHSPPTPGTHSNTQQQQQRTRAAKKVGRGGEQDQCISLRALHNCTLVHVPSALLLLFGCRRLALPISHPLHTRHTDEYESYASSCPCSAVCVQHMHIRVVYSSLSSCMEWIRRLPPFESALPRSFLSPPCTQPTARQLSQHMLTRVPAVCCNVLSVSLCCVCVLIYLS
jgi:hypothetical protein